MRHLGPRTCFQIEQRLQHSGHIEVLSWSFSCFSIGPRSGTRHGGSQKRDFCRRSDGKSLLAGCPQNWWVPRGSNHAVNLHGHTASQSLANGLLVHVVKGLSAGLFKAAPLYFNHLFTYIASCLKYPRLGLSNLPKRLGNWTATGWLGLGVVLVQQS